LRTRHIKRRLPRFGLTVRNPEKISIVCQKTKQRECPVGVLYTYCNVPIAIGVLVRQWHHREYAGVVINTSVGRALLVSTDMGNSQEPLTVKRARKAELHAFFMPNEKNLQLIKY